MRRTLVRWRVRWTTRAPWDLAGALALLLAADALVLLDVHGPLRALVPPLALLLAPGHALASALFPERARRAEVPVGEAEEREVRVERAGLGGAERAALAFGLSLALVPLAGLVLGLTPWGIGVPQVLAALTAAAFAASAVALVRRLRAPPERAFVLDLRLDAARWRAARPVDRLLAVAVALSLLAVVGVLAYRLAQPPEDAPFTELYLLGADGNATYPTEVALGDEVRVRVGVASHEGARVAYSGRLALEEGTWRDAEGGPSFVPGAAREVARWDVTLDDGARDERDLSFVPPAPGAYRLVVELRREGDDAPYRAARLLFTVATR